MISGNSNFLFDLQISRIIIAIKATIAITTMAACELGLDTLYEISRSIEEIKAGSGYGTIKIRITEAGLKGEKIYVSRTVE